MAALVTGGESGIGLACARRLAADGAVVTICGRSEQRLKLSADACGLRYVVADVTDEDEMAAALADAAASGPLRIVIASAGGSASIGPLCQLNTAGWRATLDLNATGTMLTLKYATREMTRAGGGSFVAISSIAATTVHRWFGAYGPANAAVDHMVALAADELGGIGIRVNGIRPGVGLDHRGGDQRRRRPASAPRSRLHPDVRAHVRRSGAPRPARRPRRQVTAAGRTAAMRMLIALLIGACIAIAAVAVLVHDNTAVRPASTRVLYNYGSS